MPSYYETGPWGVGDGYITIDNETITQTLDLVATNSLGTPVTKAKVWFAGNGVDSYLVQSANVTMSGSTVPVLVNGASTFYIPASGRWSDLFSTTSFALPGTATFTFVVKLKVPILIPIISDNQDGPSVPGVVTTIEQIRDVDSVDVSSYGNLLTLNFNGVQGATNYVEEVNGLQPFVSLDPSIVLVDNNGVYNYGVSLDTAIKYSGSASLISGHVTNEGHQISILAYKLSKAIAGDFRYNSKVYLSTTDANFFSPSGYGNVLLFGIGVADSSDLSTHTTVTIHSRWPDTTKTMINFLLSGVGYVNYDISLNAWHDIQVDAIGSVFYFRFDGVLLYSFDTGIDKPFYGCDAIIPAEVWDMDFSPGSYVHYDAISLYGSELDVLEITSTETITVTDNTLIQAGDTITITGVSA
jgi:hypothetical protein